jgi:hypothetical protein
MAEGRAPQVARALPRDLTSALLAPIGPMDPSVLRSALARLPEQVARLAVPRRGRGSLRLTDHDIRMALSPRAGEPPTPFAWTPLTARRSLGLPAVRQLVAGQVRTPMDAVASVLSQADRSVRQGDRPTSSLERWVSGLTPSARALVLAEATTWATRLWTALDWAAFVDTPTIGRDHWWDSPHSSLLALRSRAEVRAVTVTNTDVPVGVHLVVLSGNRRDTVRSELAVVALVEGLRADRDTTPGRIVGWWPDSGHRISLEVTSAVVDNGLAAVGHALAQLEVPSTPFQAETRAAA